MTYLADVAGAPRNCQPGGFDRSPGVMPQQTLSQHRLRARQSPRDRLHAREPLEKPVLNHGSDSNKYFYFILFQRYDPANEAAEGELTMNNAGHPHLPGQQRRQAIIRFIRGFVREHGYPSTLREISEATRLAASTISYQLSILEADGFLNRGLG